jgi:hypothetical protein
MTFLHDGESRETERSQLVNFSVFCLSSTHRSDSELLSHGAMRARQIIGSEHQSRPKGTDNTRAITSSRTHESLCAVGWLDGALDEEDLP